jgi:hypothetical protein
LSKLSKFIGVGEEININGETLTIYSITIKDIGLIEKLTELEKRRGNLTEAENIEIRRINRELIKACFKDENFTDEELIKMSLELYSELSVAVMENLNKVKDGKGLTRIRELKAKAEQEAKSG